MKVSPTITTIHSAEDENWNRSSSRMDSAFLMSRFSQVNLPQPWVGVPLQLSNPPCLPELTNTIYTVNSGQLSLHLRSFKSFWKDLVDFECSKNHNVWRFIPSDNVASLTKRPHPSKNHELPPKLLRVLDYSSSCCVQFWSRWNRSHKCKSSKPLTSCLTSCLGTPNPRVSKWAIQGTFGLGCASQEI